MKRQWLACACFAMVVACAGPRSSSDSDDAARTPSRRSEALAGRVSTEVLLGEPVSVPAQGGPLYISADPTGFLVTWGDAREVNSGGSFVGAQGHLVAT